MTREVEPLGVFGPRRRGDFELRREELAPLRDGLDVEARRNVASYLRTGTIVFALMEYTTDVIGDAFGVSGGSAIKTDGRYYWRTDAAEYVEMYGIHVEDDAVEWMRGHRWVAPSLDGDAVLEIDDVLYQRFRRPAE